MNFEEIEKYALTKPYVNTDVKWESVYCFCVFDKIFLMMHIDQSPSSLTLKAKAEKLDMLLEIPVIDRAAYLGRYHWITIDNSGNFRPEFLKNLIDESFCLIVQKLPLKKRRMLDRHLVKKN